MLPPNLTLPGIQREEKPRVGRTDPIHAGPNEVICFHAKSSDQPFGSLHLEQGHHLGMWRSIQLSWHTLLLWRSREGTQRPKITRGPTPAPQSRRPIPGLQDIGYDSFINPPGHFTDVCGGLSVAGTVVGVKQTMLSHSGREPNVE